MAAIIQRIQVRRDTAATWTTVNPILAPGEFGFETDTLKFKVGNGIALWAALPYGGADGGVLADNGNGTYTWTPAVGSAVTFGGVSSDAGNLLTLGADFKPMLAPSALVQPSDALPLQGAQTALAGTAATFSRADHVHPETLTALSYNATTTVLTYTDEAGNASTIDLSALTTDLYITGASFNATTTVLTLSDADGVSPDVTVDLSTLKGTLTDNADGTYTYTSGAQTVTFDTRRANVSVDAGNVLTLGADGLPFYAGVVLSNSEPELLGAVAAGTSTEVARADHVHTMPAFKSLTGTPANPATVSLVTVDTAGDVVFADGIDGGSA